MALTRIKTDQVVDGTLTNDDLASDIALNTSGNITTTGDLSVDNVTLTGELNGPATFYIDPAPHDPDTDGSTNGLVVIRGDLQVDGTTTTVNSTTMDVADLNITLASGAVNAAAADGAGLTVDGASATLLYDGTDDEWQLNKNLRVSASNIFLNEQRLSTDGNGELGIGYGKSGTSNIFNVYYNTTSRFVVTNTGRVGVREPSPDLPLHISGTNAYPASSGTAANGDIEGYISIRAKTLGGTHGANIGVADASPWGTWIQAQDAGNFATSYPLLLNPNGGRVGIGTTDPSGTTQSPKLAVHHSGAAPAVFNTTGSSGGYISIANQNTAYLHIGHGTNLGGGGMSESVIRSISGPLIFQTNGNNDRIVIGSGGDVGFYEDGGTNVRMNWDASAEALVLGSLNSLRPGSVSGMNNAQLAIESVSYNPASIIDNQDNATSPGMLVLGTSRGTNNVATAGGVDIVQESDVVGSLRFAAADGTDLRSNVAEILAVVTPGTTPAENAVSGDLRFQTTNQGQNTTVHMTITNEGNVGIGTASPQLGGSWNKVLHVHSSTGSGSHIRFTDTVSGETGESGLYIGQYGNDSYIINREDGTTRVRVGSSAVDALTITNTGEATFAKEATFTDSINSSSVRHSVRPTLNLDFANNKTFDPRISFYRDSLGTYYDSKGLLKYAQYNEPRFDHDPSTGESKGLLIEPARNNIFINTNNPERWSLTSFASGGFTSAANARISPDGKYNATSIIINGGDPYFYQNNLSLNGTYVFSYWIKAWGSAVGKHYTTRITNVSSNQSIADTLPSEWTRKVYEFTTGSTTNAYIGVEAPDNSPADGDEISIWGAQLELGTYVTSYVPSEELFTYRASRATYQDANGYLKEAPVDSPRYGYRWDGRNKYIETGFIQELAETNLAPQTENFSSSWYTFGYTKLQTTRTFLPNGTEDFVTKIIMDSGQVASSPTSLGVYIGTGMSRVQNNVYNTSIFAKAADENGFRIRDGLRTGAFLDVNLDNGEITNGSTSTFLNAKTEKYANGWWRISFDYQYTGATGSGGWMPIRSYNDGNGTKGFYIWGAQVESGGCTSYIPNYSGASGAVTRGEDVTYSTSSTRQRDEVFAKNENVTSWYNAEEGTLLTEDSVEPDHNYAMVWSLQNTDSIGDGYISQFQIGTGGNFNTDTRYTGANFDVASGTQSGAGVFTKRAIRLKDDDMNAGSNGTLPTSADTDGHLPSDVSVLHIGYRSDGYQYAGHMKKFVYYPVALTDNELKALTEND